MKGFYFALLFTLVSSFSFAQKQANIWYFGQYAGLDFNAGSPVTLTNSKMSTNEGCFSIADRKTGQLLFYSNGDSIWDRNHNVMPNGKTLTGHQSSSQSGITVPMPGSSTKYYVFTVDAQAGFNQGSLNGYGGLAYSIVDMTLNGGNGDVTVLNQSLVTPTCEKVAAVRHCNGKDYWVVTHEFESNSFYAYRVTSAGVQAPVVTNIGVTPSDPFLGFYGNTASIGYLKFSHDASKLAIAHYVDLNTVEIFNFDNNTGAITNKITDTNFSNASGQDGPYGLSFSPDDSRLYVGYVGNEFVADLSGNIYYNVTSKVYQYNMLAGSNAAILSSRTMVGSELGVLYGALQTGPDGKIYLAKVDENSTSGGANYLDAINSPNSLGAACGFQKNAVFLNTSGVHQSLFGLPDIVENFLIPTYVSTLTYPTGCASNGSLVFTDTSLSGNIQSKWDFGDPGSGAANTSTLRNPTHTFSTNGTFTVKLILTNECLSDTATKQVVINNTVLNINAGNDLSICSGSSTPINVTGGTGATTYSWSPATGLSSSTVSGPTASPAATTTYTVTALDNGCTDKDTVTVTVITNVVATVSHDTTVCGGGNAPLKASGGSVYSWSPATGLSSSTVSNPNATPAATTTYTVTVTGGTCGTDTKNVIVSVIPMPAINAGADTLICSGTSAQLHSTGANITTYSWAPATGLSSSTISNPVNNPANTITYTVTANAGTQCTASDNIIVTVILGVTAVVRPDTTVCGGSSVKMSSSGGSNYTWNPATGLSSSTISNPIATPAVTTTYTVDVTTGGSCGSDSKSVVISVIPAAVISAGNDTVICTGTTAQLNATGSNINTYEWSPATGLSNSTGSNPSASPISTITYTVTANAGTTCPVTDDIEITVINGVIAQVSNDTTVCSGISAQLKASGGSTYLWKPLAGLNDSTIAAPLATPGITTTYTVVVSGGSCGADSANVVVAVIPMPAINAGADVPICVGGSAQITVTASNVSTYLWSPATGLNSATISNPVATPAASTTYTVVANSGTACTASDDIVVTVNTGNVLNVGPDTTLCPGGSAQLQASGGATYSWSPAEGLSNDTIPDPVASPSISTTYTITISGSGCGTSTLFDTVTIASVTPVYAGEDVTIEKGNSVVLAATEIQGATYYWYPSTGLNMAYTRNPVASPSANTTYTITVLNPDGCSSSDEVVVNVYLGPFIMYPGAFSPNNDGINDALIPVYYKVVSMQAKLFNRWGEAVFETSSFDLGWDGTKGGASMPVGVYVYYIKAIADDGTVLEQKGNVSLLR